MGFLPGFCFGISSTSLRLYETKVQTGQIADEVYNRLFPTVESMAQDITSWAEGRDTLFVHVKEANYTVDFVETVLSMLFQRNLHVSKDQAMKEAIS